MKIKKVAVLAFAAAVFGLHITVQAGVITFTGGAISIPGSGTSGPGSPFPSIIAVSGVGGTVIDVNVSINSLSHPFADDLEMLLVGPTGVKVTLMSDVGGDDNWVSANLVFDDAASNAIPSGGVAGNSTLAAGTYKPSSDGAPDTLPAPAPGLPYSLLLSSFNGLNPNGNWSLFVADDLSGDRGSISSWSITLTTVPEPGSLALLGLGLAGLAAARRRRSR